MFSKKLSSRYDILVKLAGILAPLGELGHLAGFANETAELSRLGRAGMLGETVEVGTSMLNRSDDLISLIKKDPTEFSKTFEALNPSQKLALREMWGKIPSATKEGKTIEEFAISAAKTSEKLRSNAISIEKFIKSKPSEFLERYAKEPEFKATIDKIWKSHPDGSKLGAVEDFAKAELSKSSAAVPEAVGEVAKVAPEAGAEAAGKAAPEAASEAARVAPEANSAIESIDDSLKIFSEGNEQAAIKEYQRLKQLQLSEGTPVTAEEMKKISDAIDSNKTLSPEAATSLKESFKKLSPEKWEEAMSMGKTTEESGKAISNRVAEAPITEADDASTIINKVDASTTPIPPEQVEIVTEAAKDPKKAGEMLRVENEDKLKNAVTNKPELDPAVNELANTIKNNPEQVSAALKDAAETSTPAAKGVNWRRAGKIAAYVAAGIGGIALINALWGGDDEAVEEAKAEIESAGGGNGGGSSPQTGRLDFEGASKVMMDKGYLGSVQRNWTDEFGAAFREFIDAGTANNSAVTPTNLVGGQKWVDVAPSLGFSPDQGGALSAIAVLGRFAPSKGGSPNTPPISGGRVPENTGGGRGGASTKEDVLADIISRLYNNRLVEGGGGIFSNDLRQTQTMVESVEGGASPTGYKNLARLLLSRNPALADVLPATRITDVLSKRNIKAHPAYEAVRQAQETIHKIYEAANPGIINPLRRKKVIDNIKRYIASPAGGNWSVKPATTASNSVDRFVKLAEDRKARIKVEVLASLTPAERAIVRKNKMKEI